MEKKGGKKRGKQIKSPKNGKKTLLTGRRKPGETLTQSDFLSVGEGEKKRATTEKGTYAQKKRALESLVENRGEGGMRLQKRNRASR